MLPRTKLLAARAMVPMLCFPSPHRLSTPSATCSPHLDLASPRPFTLPTSPLSFLSLRRPPKQHPHTPMPPSCSPCLAPLFLWCHHHTLATAPRSPQPSCHALTIIAIPMAPSLHPYHRHRPSILLSCGPITAILSPCHRSCATIHLHASVCVHWIPIVGSTICRAQC